MRSAEIMETTETYGAHNYHPLPVVISRAEGIWVEDCDGDKYMDMLSAYSALNHGHRHPAIIQAMMDQLQKVTLTSRAFYNDQLGPLCEQLAVFCHMDMVLPMNTGAEAVETALKTARKWGYRVKGVPEDQAEIIACANNFHGRTVTIISFSTESLYKKDFGPFTPGFQVIPYGDLDALTRAVTPRTVGFLVEPIQGEGGVIIPPDGYLKGAMDICRQNGVLLMMDEIQTGLCRTGKRFACDYEDVQPDMLIIGKALGGGVYPISAVVSDKEYLGLLQPGEHGSTFGGNPLACAVARVALNVLVDDKLDERAFALGQYFMKGLRAIPSPHVKEIRGRGLLVGAELHSGARGARRFCEALMQKGLLCKETHENVIRFAPPLIIEKPDLDWALERIHDVLTTL